MSYSAGQSMIKAKAPGAGVNAGEFPDIGLQVCTSNRGKDGGGLEWFSFRISPSPSNEHSSDRIRRKRRRYESSIIKPCLATTEIYVTFSWKFLGSTMYLIGQYAYGVNEECKNYRNVHCWSSENNSWTKGPLMNSRRDNPALVAVDGKLYAFGGLLRASSTTEPWAEVLDPAVGTWRPLPSPPPPTEDLIRRHPYAVLDHPRRILFGTEGAIYYFDFSSQEWSKSTGENYGLFGSGSSEAVVVDTTLYWFSDKKWAIVAYDLEKKLWLKGTVVGLEDGKSNHWGCDPQLVHLHGRETFCLIWTDAALRLSSDFDPDFDPYQDSNPADDNRTAIHCAKIRIRRSSKGDERRRVDVKCLSIQSYTVDHRVMLLNGVHKTTL